MATTIKLHPLIAHEDAQRLRFFAGRSLSEQEFGLMQAYVDARCDQVLAASERGIIEGLEVTQEALSEALGNPEIRIAPGLAVGGDYRAVRIFYPIVLDWQSIKVEYLNRVTAPGAEQQEVHGFYFLTVKRWVAQMDYQPDAEPCTRTEMNPLRDSRLETYGTLDLQFISDIPLWMEQEPLAAANRILEYHLDYDFWDQDIGAVPVALLKVEGGEIAWLDQNAGRYMALANSRLYALFNHWQAVAARGFEPFNAAQSLTENLGVAFLPSAGTLPEGIVTEIAGRQDDEDSSLWLPPVLHFSPGDLQVELLPIPANAVDGILEYERNRGVIDLVHHQQDRLRIMVAVEEQAYRPSLMDLPEIDLELVHDLYHRHALAGSSYNAWANKFLEIYNDLDSNLTVTDGEPDADSLERFTRIYKTPGPSDAFPKVPTDDPAIAEKLGIPVGQAEPMNVMETIASLISGRIELGGDLPRPYSRYLQNGDGDVSDRLDMEPLIPPDGEPAVEPSRTRPDGPGLYRRQFDLQEQIAALESSLAQSADLIADVSDFMTVQRQQLDSITVSFSTLAGGVAGDGSGLNLMRWAGSVNFEPPTVVTPEE